MPNRLVWKWMKMGHYVPYHHLEGLWCCCRCHLLWRHVINSLISMGLYVSPFFDELHSRLTISVNIRTPTTYLSGYESSTFWLQYKYFNHPQSLKCEGAVPLRKCCLELTFFSVQYCTICFFFDHSKSTMAAAGPACGELLHNMVDK